MKVRESDLSGKIKKSKLQIALLKFGGDWILHPEILEFGFYLIKFGGVWILHPDVSEFGFYPLYFRSVWILLPKVLRYLNPNTPNFRW